MVFTFKVFMVVLYAINSLLLVDTRRTCINSGELQNQRLEKCVEDGGSVFSSLLGDT